MDATPLLAIAAFALAGVVFAPVQKLIAHFGGWQDLAEAFPGRPTDPAGRLLFCSVSIGQLNYGSCIAATVADGHLTIAPMFPFRAHHPPVSIPLARLDRRSSTVRNYRMTEYDLTDTRRTLWLSPAIARQVEAATA